MITFVVYGEPQGKGRANFANGHAYTPERTRTYEAEIVSSFRRDCPGFARWERGIPIRVRIKAVYGIPKSDSQTKRAMKRAGAIRPTKKPDCDNIEKVFLDALNGIAWHDDAQIVDIKVAEVYGDSPRVEIGIEPVGY